MNAILVDDYYLPLDGADDSPSFNRAFAAGLAQRRHIGLTAGKIYASNSSINILPDADGWTPGLFGNGASVILTAEAGGFRYRGVKSGEAANPASGFIRDLTIDHDTIAISNGTRGIAIENGGGLVFENVNGLNCRQAYHILNFRYADGGAPTGSITVRNCRVIGNVLASTDDDKWYAFSDTGDLSVAMPGDTAPPGATVAIATTRTGSTGSGTPNVAVTTFWSNGTAAAVIIPQDLTATALAAAGLTEGSSTATLNGTTVAAVMYEYYASGGVKLPTCVVRAADGLVDGLDVVGGYYGVYLSGTDRYSIRNCSSTSAIRGFANEWGAAGVSMREVVVRESLSSAFLFGYNCPFGLVDDFTIEELSSRWVGEALVNVQLSCPNFTLGRGTINTRSTVTNGQYMIKGSVDCSNFSVDGPVRIKGDCAKGFIVIESAYNSAISGANPEHYPQSTIYNGGASKDMTNISIRNVEIINETTKSAAPTALTFMQVADAVNGEIGLSNIRVENVVATSPKHVRALKIYEGAQTDKQINDIALVDVSFAVQSVPATAAARMILPRRWAHFSNVKNVTNLDDEVVRMVPDVATPDLTFGKHWFDNGVTPILGFLGGQGASSSEGYAGRELYFRGNSTRALTTISGVSGTRDGVRLQTSPTTPSGAEILHFVFSRPITSWVQI